VGEVERRYIVRKAPATPLETRIFPEVRDKPFRVFDTHEQVFVGRRYTSKSGAIVKRDALERKEHTS
jgi:hypothetical protein